MFLPAFVCLLARLPKNAFMDLDKMLPVDRCRDTDELINFLRPIRIIVQMPEPDCFLRYRLSAAMRNFTSGKPDVYVLAAVAKCGFKMVIRPTAAATRGFIH